MLSKWKWKTMSVSILVSLINLSPQPFRSTVLMKHVDSLGSLSSEPRQDKCNVVWSVLLVKILSITEAAGNSPLFFYSHPRI